MVVLEETWEEDIGTTCLKSRQLVKDEMNDDVVTFRTRSPLTSWGSRSRCGQIRTRRGEKHLGVSKKQCDNDVPARKERRVEAARWPREGLSAYRQLLPAFRRHLTSGNGSG